MCNEYLNRTLLAIVREFQYVEYMWQSKDFQNVLDCDMRAFIESLKPGEKVRLANGR